MENKHICDNCNKIFSSKSTLLVHKKNAKYCLESKGLVPLFKCLDCDKSFSSKRRLDEHSISCKIYIQKIFEKCQKLENNEVQLKQVILDKERQLKDILIDFENKERQLKQIILDKERQLKDILIDFENKEKYMKELLEKANNTIADIAKQPKINNTTNIKGNQNIQNLLTTYKTYEEQTDRNRILSVAKETDMEKYFWRGQKGLAQFCVEHIAKTQDGKMIICCTDPSRGRFKHVNDNNQICEDLDARSFTSKISEPIKEVVEEVHNNIQKGIEDKLVKEEECDQNFLNSKKNLALEKYIQLKNIDNSQYNKEYKKELCVLLNL
jgi:hypothetical protein